MSNLQLSAVLELIDKVSPTLAKIALPLAKTQKAFDDAKKSLKDFESQSKMLETFGARTQKLAETGVKLQQAKDKLAALNEQINNSDRVTKALLKQQQSAQNQVDRLGKSMGVQTAELKGLETRLKQAGINTDNFADEQARLAGEIKKATTHVDKQAAALEKQQKLKARYEAVGAGLQQTRDTAAKVAAATMAATAVPVKLAIDFESAMADVKKVVDFGGVPELAAAEFKALSDEVVKLSTIRPMSANDIAAIVALGGQSGIAKNELMDFADSAVKMGIAFDIGATEAGQAMAELRTAFGMSQTDVVALADKINYLGNNTPAAAKSIMEIVQRIGPLGEVGGFASGSIAALGATLKGMGVQEEIAATGIKNMMLALNAGESATASQQAVFKQLGLDHAQIAKQMQTDAEGTTLKVLESLGKLEDHQKAAALKELFGSESIGAIAPLLNNLDALKKNLTMVGDASKYAGSMSGEYDARAATTANNIQLLKNNLSALAINFGSVLLPAVNGAISKISALAQKIQAWADAHPKLAAFVMKAVAALGIFLGVVAGLATVLLTVIGPMALLHASLTTLGGGGMITAVVGVLTRFGGLLTSLATSSIPIILGGLTKLGSAFMLLLNVVRTVGFAMMTNPILAVIGLIAMGAIYIWQNWATLGPKFAALWANITAGASALWARLVAIWNNIKTSVIAAANQLWSNLSARFGSGIAALIAIIAAFSPVGLFMRAFAAVFSYFAGLRGEFRGFGGDMIEGLKQGIMGRLNSVLSSIKNVASQIKSAFTSTKAMNINSPSRVFAGYGDNIMQGLNNGLLANTAPIGAMLATSQRLKNALDTAQIAFDGSRAMTAKAAPNTAQGGNAAPIVINIYTQKGQSEEDIARLVADKLGQAQSQSTGLYDYETQWG